MEKKRKVTFLVANNFTHDNRTLRQAKALGEAGYKVTVIATATGQKLPAEETRDGLKIKRVLAGWLPVVPRNKQELTTAKKYLEAVMTEKAEIYIAKDLDTLFYGEKAAKTFQAKLVYLADEYWQDLKINDIGKKTKAYFKTAFYFGEKLLAKKADLVITVNEALAQKMKNVLHLKRKPLVILNTPESTKISGGSKIKKDTGFDGKKLVVYLGILVDGRGLEDLVLAAKELPENIGIALFGYGNLKPKLLSLIENEGLKSRVKIFDPIPYEKMLSYASGADLGVIPILPVSISYRLCLPNKFFEYILSGLPICSSNLPVLKTLIEKYQIGATYPAGNSSALAGCIKEMLYNESKYLQYKRNLAVAAKELNWEVEKAKYLKAIKEL